VSAPGTLPISSTSASHSTFVVRWFAMPLSWNEIRANAIAFSREWKDESSEDAEAKSFWDAFFQVFGITRRRIASFEKPVVKSDGKGGFIDLLWKGMLLVEHKSRGLDLDRAFHQATDYFQGLKERDLPRYVVVSDFARFRLYDLDGDNALSFRHSNQSHAYVLGEVSWRSPRVECPVFSVPVWVIETGLKRSWRWHEVRSTALSR
jgi:hypothetical protein